ncbi:DNA polymerase III, subunit gamma and tau [Ehrlichia chaffeensis str. Heartland]|nr:DNA polymerase III subunit gamma/tau [Ehrlichia chaffeensis]AHX03195.1 DNA polymerase III, subunit gamma and tau [Ehrlichia chaffeensis str. Heartland]AHX05111.1 DNA polymerase III, subunit gamma and tau [Ehrlichia chaffeensis str. Jax]AHX06100.1 DNA polymerase III, subunit gamma and tau [Ehrlichia chaffeensis str. Liberty]AHX07863.1 DNA polymerase III, subunit gamma and tau [Ehrlichia chaffeensis str. Osceola]AHX09213.1 DNA polymerase III, subunit gamma and tau [Ehrlichia chaffeensis str. 
MSFALKYRPSNFKDLIGQEVLVRVLHNAFHLNKIPESILLTGISGVGKTTAARIISMCLNCISGPTSDPCNTCQNCISIKNFNHPDVIEIDAASNTSIEDVKVILENSRYMPISSKFKVYIIDEVHMLSNSAFNALLKVLEEPAPYVKFILATTEVKKIPVTIISRCQRFDFQRISTDKLVDHLKVVAKKENVSFDEESIKLIAYNADGSIRNALSLLEQAAIYSNKILSENITKEMLGYVSRHTLLEIIEPLIIGNATEALNKFEEACNSYNSVIILDNMLQIIYEICYFSITKKDNSTSDNSIITYIKNEKILSPTFLSRLWQMLFKGIQEVKSSSCIKQAANMLIIRLCYLSSLPSPKQIIDKIQGKINNTSDINRKALLELLKSNNMQDLYNQIYESESEVKNYKDEALNIETNQALSKDFHEDSLNFFNNSTNKKCNVPIEQNFDINKSSNPCYNQHLDPTVCNILQEFDGAKVINIENIKKNNNKE